MVDEEKSGMRKKTHLDAGIGGGSESIIELAFERVMVGRGRLRGFVLFVKFVLLR